MKTLLQCLLCCSIIFISSQLKALDHINITSAYLHLDEVNAQWVNYHAAAPQNAISFKTDIDRIQYHLQLVEKHLRNNFPQNISAEAKANRLFLLNKLKTYAEKKQFPANTYHTVRTPYFIDDFGVYCAVGFLIKESGNNDLALKINKEHRFNYIKDIRTEGLANWAQKFGFTVDELAWIQPGYQPQTQFLSVGKGTNGPVTELYNSDSDGRLYITGVFDSIDNLPCLNIGYFANGNLHCLGNGIDGIVNSVATNGDGVFVAGSFNYENKVYALAMFKNNNWQFINLSANTSSTGSKIFVNVNGDKWLVAGSAKNIFEDELWLQKLSGSWQKVLDVNGKIYDIENTPFGLAFTGAFDTVNIWQNETAFKHASKSILFFNNGNWNISSLPLNDTIYVAKSIDGKLLLGGNCSRAEGKYDVCVTRFTPDSLYPELLAQRLTSENSAILALEPLNSNEIIIGGRFKQFVMFGIDCINLAKFNIKNKRFESLAVFNGDVASIETYDRYFFIGGNFKDGDLKHLARIASFVGVNSYENPGSTLAPYPNPAKNTLNIPLQNIGAVSSINIFDMQGKQLAAGTADVNASTYSTDISALKNGLYLLKIVNKNGDIFNSKFEVLK